MLPFFLGWIGGLIGYFVLKDRNSGTAKNILIFGIIWTFIPIIIVAIAGFLFGFFGTIA